MKQYRKELRGTKENNPIKTTNQEGRFGHVSDKLED